MTFRFRWESSFHAPDRPQCNDHAMIPIREVIPPGWMILNEPDSPSGLFSSRMGIPAYYLSG